MCSWEGEGKGGEGTSSQLEELGVCQQFISLYRLGEPAAVEITRTHAHTHTGERLKWKMRQLLTVFFSPSQRSSQATVWVYGM